MAETKRRIGNVLLSIGSFFILIEIIGILTDTLGGPSIFYFLGGLVEGLGVVFFLGGIAFREEYEKNRMSM
ncbi:MAG: hypothetical protein ACFFF9_01315 [Candidatus Thorarchaeota archaeon]